MPAQHPERTAGAPEQIAGRFQAQTQIILTGRAVEMPAEQALQLARGQADRHGKLLATERVFDVQVHDADCIEDLGVRDTGARLDVMPLCRFAGAHVLVEGDLGDLVREIRAMLNRDQAQHHVERRHAAGAGDAVPVDGENVRRHLDVRKLFSQRPQIFPVDRAASAVQQVVAREKIGAGADRPEGASHRIQAPQLVSKVGIQRKALNVDACAQQCNIGINKFTNRFIRHHFAAIAGHD